MNIKINKTDILNQISLILLALSYYAYASRRIFGLDRYFTTNLHSTYFRIVLLLGFLVIIVLKQIYEKKSKIDFFISILIILFTLALSIYKEKTLLSSWIMNFDIFTYVVAIIACKDINYKTIIKVLLFLYFILNSLSLLLFPLIFKLRNEIGLRAGMSIRYQLGKTMGSEVALIYYYIVLYYCYLRNSKITFREIVLLVAASFVMYYLTNTRYPFILSMAFIILFCNIDFIKKVILSKQFMFLIAIMIILAPLILLTLSVKLDPSNPIYNVLNNLLSGRIKLVENAYNDYGIKLFGNEILYSMVDYNIIDPSFFVILFEYGIVFYGIFIVFLLYFLYIIYKSNDKYMMLVFIFSIFDMFFNITISTFQYNLLLFVLSYRNTMCPNLQFLKN